MYLLRYWLLFILITLFFSAHAQQDMDLHLNSTFLTGKNILKVKRDFHDPYLWVLAQNNEVYRINSVTKTIDNYTNQFSSYSNFHFIDIAGCSKDTVFIATNTSNLLEYKKGTLKIITNADGVLGIVNSIGVDYTHSYLTNNTYGMAGKPDAQVLVIGTDKGMCHYDYENDVMLSGASHVPARVFDASYRTEMFSDVEFGSWSGTETDQYPVIEFTPYTVYGGYIYYGDNGFGNNINTAYYTSGIIDDISTPSSGVYFNQLWGTENGIAQNSRNYSSSLTWPYKQYLPGVNINKLTSIVGLKAFGTSSYKAIAKENVLAGSDVGLYFSTSGYHNISDGYLNVYSFTHYDGLGNKKINDICVNATSYTTPICEDGIWVAAIDGLYLLKPDYGAYVDTQNIIQAIQFDGLNYDKTSVEICASTTVNAYINSYAYNGNLFQWYKNGVEIPNQSSTTLIIKDAGDYYAVLYDPCSALHFESNHLTVTQIAAPVFAFNYPDVLNYCAGSTASLKTDDKPNYQYRWYKDGVLNGITTATLNNITVTGKYKVEVSACAGSWVPSKEVQINFIPIPVPVLTTDKTGYCDGDQAVLSAAVPIDGSNVINWSAYQYSWVKDGSPIIGSAPSIKVSQAGKYKVMVSGCSGAVSSNEIQVDFIKMEKPAISADKPAYCIGDNARLTTSITADPFTAVTWFKDDNLLTDQQNKSEITTNQPGTYLVNVVDNSNKCSISSASYTLSFTPPPTVSIQQFVNSTLCSGETVDLKASYTSGTIKWSTGETTDNIGVKSSGTYNAMVTTAAGCVVEQSSTVQFLPTPTLAVPNATLCQYTKESITLTAPAGFAKYEWNGQAGSTIFVTDKLGSVNLTVTDNNGCHATQTIVISSHCDDIHIPNAFTPNADGHNDTWEIAGLEGDASTTVKVYNRLGSLIFQSQGYAIPWNGTYSGKKIPTGVYYYVISTKGAKQVLSGSVTVLY
ncbi:gliding motility-associated C-terminal domain-containing protein [Mucilaginibacter sp. FT3.2]|uniref:T9SS type B sorting domain-containing protein n=1 Tax=Mucilaginibacter sp. FT3.2 TaxID=2723090 RepID=UPI00160D0505|nr:gliding motility-associated C-terminal domain-containing protein [Mucilaginibacter sp. FT3.2]MBB6232098.1 gliding motility-associated-like protein [Mucilaginibacter sp. FT3.2]